VAYVSEQRLIVDHHPTISLIATPLPWSATGQRTGAEGRVGGTGTARCHRPDVTHCAPPWRGRRVA